MSVGAKIKLKCPTTGKRMFGTEEAANAALSRIWHPKAENRNTQYGKTPTRAYECPECGGWHLTADMNPTRRRA